MNPDRPSVPPNSNAAFITNVAPKDNIAHLVAEAVLDAALLLSNRTGMSMRAKVSQIMHAASEVSCGVVKVDTYTPAVSQEYPIPNPTASVTPRGPDPSMPDLGGLSHAVVDGVPIGAVFPPNPVVVFKFPGTTGYDRLLSAKFIGPSNAGVKLGLKAQHEGCFAIGQLRSHDNPRTTAYRLTFVENGLVKKIEPIVYAATGVCILAPDVRTMVFPTWPRFLKQLGVAAQHLLYISIPCECLIAPGDDDNGSSKISRNPVDHTTPATTTSSQLHFLGIAGEGGNSLGAALDIKNMLTIFSNMAKQAPVSTRRPAKIVDLESPNLRDTLKQMDAIYNSVAADDTVVFYFSGRGRQIFQHDLLREPVAGLMLGDATQSKTTIDSIGDLTNTWVRYWCNALYLVKHVRSVILILDTSFRLPQTVVEANRSRTAQIMSAGCNAELLPAHIAQMPSWFDVGRALDRPDDILQARDTMKTHPYYFAPSNLWAHKHVVVQASRDDQHAAGCEYYKTLIRKKPTSTPIDVSLKLGHMELEGVFTHTLYRVLLAYFPSDINGVQEHGAPLETYSNLANRIKNASAKWPLEQTPVFFVGDSVKSTKLFSCDRLPVVCNAVNVEALSKDGRSVFVNTGFLGLPPVGLALKAQSGGEFSIAPTYKVLDAHGDKAVVPSDPFISQVDALYWGTDKMKVGDSLSILPIVSPSRPVTIAIPHGTSKSDPELMKIAQSVLDDLKTKGIARADSSVVEHLPFSEQPTLWKWTVFGDHKLGLRSKDRVVNVAEFATGLGNQIKILSNSSHAAIWERVCIMTCDFIRSMCRQIFSDINKIPGQAKEFGITDINHLQLDPKACDIRMTLERFRAWLLIRMDDVDFTEGVLLTPARKSSLFNALASLTDAINLAPAEDTEFMMTVCRNNVVRPHDPAYSRFKQFAVDPAAPALATLKYQVTATLKMGLDCYDLGNYRKAIPNFSDVLDWTFQFKEELESEDIEVFRRVASVYTRYAHLQSQFFLAATPPQEMDAFLCKPDPVVNCTTYLCTPRDATELAEIAIQWYWRSWKVDRLAEMQTRHIPGIPLGYGKAKPMALGLKESEESFDGDSVTVKDCEPSPVTMSVSIVTKVATCVPRTSALLLHDAERLELKVRLRDTFTQSELDSTRAKLYQERKDTTHPKARYRFHVLDFQSNGTIKLLTKGTNTTGHCIKIPFSITDMEYPVRLGAITANHEPLDLHFQQSAYKLHAPLTHVFVIMSREWRDSYPDIFDFRFFEQTADIDLDTRARRAAIHLTPGKIQKQIDKRKLRMPCQQGGTASVVNGDCFQVNWFRLRTLPSQDHSANKFRAPPEDLHKQVLTNNGWAAYRAGEEIHRTKEKMIRASTFVQPTTRVSPLSEDYKLPAPAAPSATK